MARLRPTALLRYLGIRGAKVAKEAVVIPAKGPKRKPGRPRADQRANTLAATKPWEAAKVSRRTWFRHQAKAPMPANENITTTSKIAAAVTSTRMPVDDAIAAEGAAARRAGTPIEACPYKSQAFADSWRAGWRR